MPGDIYCIDTSALIDVRRHYPSEAFGVWPALERLVAEERLFAPVQVLDELEQFDDDLRPWLKRHRSMFRKTTPEVARAVLRLQREVGQLGDPRKLPEPADPWVVACSSWRTSGAAAGSSPPAAWSSPTKVDESQAASTRFRTRATCAMSRTCGVLDVFVAEGWRFDLVAMSS